MITMYLHLMLQVHGAITINYTFCLKGNTIDGLQRTIHKNQVTKYKIIVMHLQHTLTKMSTIPFTSVNSNTEHRADISSNDIHLTQTVAPALHSPLRIAPELFSSSMMTHLSTSFTHPTNATATSNRHSYNLRSRKKNL